MIRIVHAFFFGLPGALAAAAALAHPGHIENDGHGHSHWLAIGITACVAALLGALWLRRWLVKKRPKVTRVADDI